MKNYIQDGERITVIAPKEVTSGAGVVVGDIFGVAEGAAENSQNVVLLLEGVVELPKKTGETWDLGAALYWDDTNSHVTTDSQSTKKIGVATVGVASATDSGNVRLNGAW